MESRKRPKEGSRGRRGWESARWPRDPHGRGRTGSHLRTHRRVLIFANRPRRAFVGPCWYGVASRAPGTTRPVIGRRRCVVRSTSLRARTYDPSTLARGSESRLWHPLINSDYGEPADHRTASPTKVSFVSVMCADSYRRRRRTCMCTIRLIHRARAGVGSYLYQTAGGSTFAPSRAALIKLLEVLHPTFTLSYRLIILSVDATSPSTVRCSCWPNLTIKSTQSFGDAHMGRMCVRVFIAMSARKYLRLYCVSQKKTFTLSLTLVWWFFFFLSFVGDLLTVSQLTFYIHTYLSNSHFHNNKNSSFVKLQQ
jgi:hypothetical protein